jgi:two-component system, OmpR family, sensor histidine kinase KdpD
MVCVSSSVEAARVIRNGARAAGRLGARCYAVYVETPKERPERLNPKDRETLATNIALAERLGATIVRVRAPRPAAGLIEFARREGITHVVLGESQRSRWEILLHGSILDRLLRGVPDTAVQVVPVESSATNA